MKLHAPPLLLVCLGLACAPKGEGSARSSDGDSPGTTDDPATDDGSGRIPVYVGDLEFRTDAEVQLIEGYETVQGSVALMEGVTDLSPLYALTEITGSLRIEDTTTLASLTGLEQLTTIGADLGIRGSTLEDLSGLDGLESLEGLSIEDTVHLQDLGALSSVTRLSRNLVVNRSALPTLAGLERIESVSGYLNIQQASALTSLSGLGGLASVGKTVFIVQNPLLGDVEGLASLQSVGESLSITDLPVLTEVNLQVQSVRDSVQIVRNPLLTSIQLDALQTAGEVEFHGNGILTGVSLPSLVEVEGWLQIDDNDSLVSLGDFSALTTVESRVSITRNHALSTLSSSLPVLVEVGENFDVHDNPSLPACEVDAVGAALTDLGGTVVNTGNDDSAVCD